MFYPDDNLENVDWTKKIFDILGLEDEKDLRAYLKSIGSSWEEFK